MRQQGLCSQELLSWRSADGEGATIAIHGRKQWPREEASEGRTVMRRRSPSARVARGIRSKRQAGENRNWTSCELGWSERLAHPPFDGVNPHSFGLGLLVEHRMELGA